MICWNKVLLFKISLMKIKNFKYIFWFLFSFPVFLFSFSFGQCSEDMVSWTSGAHLSRCNWTNERYDNRKQLDTFSDNARVFFLMAWVSWQPCVETSAWRQRSENIVRALQQQMQFAVWWDCSTCVDWKLWDHTLTALENCAALWCGGQTVPTLSGNSLACPEWLEEDRLTHCCVEPSAPPQISYSPVQPTLTDDTSWNWEDNKANLTLQFNDSQIYVSWWHVWSNSITTNVWSISNRNENHLGMKITFTVNVWDANSFTVNYLSWIITFSWGASSLWWSKTFNRYIDCGNTPKSGDIACATTYGPSYTESGVCCVTQCAVPQKTWWNCNPWYSVNGSGCCIQNNCQNLPKTWTTDDCSNWWWMWSYNVASGCCIKGESCQEPALPPTNWQCSWSLVLDPAGECCITCANPADGSWNCQSWYTLQWSCCFADNMCWDDQINQWWQCKPCEEEWTKPNEPHTRCICDPDLKCCGVQLNNVVPFIWDCIEMNWESNRDNTTNVTSVTAFPILMQGLMKILMSVIMIFSFLMIIVAWLMIVSWAFGWNWFATWKKIIKNVIISLILLWCSWLILSLINPSFFGG